MEVRCSARTVLMSQWILPESLTEVNQTRSSTYYNGPPLRANFSRNVRNGSIDGCIFITFVFLTVTRFFR